MQEAEDTGSNYVAYFLKLLQHLDDHIERRDVTNKFSIKMSLTLRDGSIYSNPRLRLEFCFACMCSSMTFVLLWLILQPHCRLAPNVRHWMETLTACCLCSKVETGKQMALLSVTQQASELYCVTIASGGWYWCQCMEKSTNILLGKKIQTLQR